MSLPDRPLSVLHMVIALRASSTQYNEHCLPLLDRREIAICTFFKASITTPSEIALFEGDGTLRGFWRALSNAIAHRPYDLIHAHAAPAGVLLIAMNLLRHRSLGAAVYTVHNSFQNFTLRNKLFLYPIFLFFPRVVLCSNAVFESLPKSLRWLGRGKISVVQNGVDTDRIDSVVANYDGRRPTTTFTILSVARLISRKNPLTLMEAFGCSKDAESNLVYVGDGDLRPHLMEQADRMNLRDRVRFTGLVSRAEVYRYMVESDIYISASRGEGLPVAVLEAMASSRPVILSDISPHREIAGDVDYIPLVPPDDVDRFAREIERLRKMTFAERTDIGERCRTLVEDRFSLKAMHRSYDRVYAEVIRQTRRRVAGEILGREFSE